MFPTGLYPIISPHLPFSIPTMNDSHATKYTECSSLKKRRTLHRIVKALAITLLSVLLLCVLLAAGITYYFNPQRLTAFINREASEYLDADVTVTNARFTFWSTFPRFCIETDSITVISRTLKDVAPEIRRQLPANADFLFSLKSMRGGINIPRILRRQYVLHDVELSGLRLNMVAYSDSINNYNIFPDITSTDEKIPFFTANSVKINAPGILTLFSAATQTKTSATFGCASLIRLGNNDETYTLAIPGRISFTSGNLHVLNNFPFLFNGKVILHFHPFRVKLEGYHVDLGNTHGKLNMDLHVGKDVKINNLTYRVSTFNLLGLLKYLPVHLPTLKEITADICVNVSARLLSPFNLSSETLPQIDVNFRIPPGRIAYGSDSDNSGYIDYGTINTDFFFDGLRPDQSHIRLNPVVFCGKGFDCILRGDVSRLTSSPQVDLCINGNADLHRTLAGINNPYSSNISGKLSCNAGISFGLGNLSLESLTEGIKNVTVNGGLILKNVSALFPSDSTSIFVNQAKFTFASSSTTISETYFGNADTSAALTADSATLLFGKNRVLLSDLKISGNKKINGNFPIDPAKLFAGIKADISVRRFFMSAPGVTFHGNKLHLAAVTMPPLKKSEPIHLTKLYASANDSLVIASVPHTPLFISATAPESLLHLMRKGEIRLHLTAARSTILTPAFPANNEIENLDLTADYDSIALRNLTFRTDGASARLSASAGNLRQFLFSPKPTGIPINANLQIDTVNINRIAETYRNGQILIRGESAAMTKPQLVNAASDSITFLIPRNLDLNLKASIAETIYTNLHLYNLHTGLVTKCGNLLVKDLGISSDFGDFSLNFSYNTASLPDMAMMAELGVSNVHLVNFFRNFHTLLLMMPQMKNLEGVLSAKVIGRAPIFPDMCTNTGGITADINVQGRGLLVHQNQFIRKITKLMLIHTADDLHIANMNVHATVHDNLLELYPFDFKFNRYNIRMQGLNNFNGKLHYNIGVLKSPVPFPFGVNITGMFYHPRVLPGKAGMTPKEAEEITSDVMETNDFNIMRQLKYYLQEFLEKAAESAATDN